MWCIVACVALFLSAVSPSRSISCYVCKSSIHGHERCGEDDVDVKGIPVYNNCTECQLSIHAINDVSLIQRQCVSVCIPQDVDEDQGPVAARLTVQCCDTDFCNSAPAINHNVIIMLSLALFITVMIQINNGQITFMM